VIDARVPRDADPAINELDGVFSLRYRSLEGIVRQSLEVRRSEIIRCEQMTRRSRRSVRVLLPITMSFAASHRLARPSQILAVSKFFLRVLLKLGAKGSIWRV